MIPNPSSDRKSDGRIGQNRLLFFFLLLLLLSSTFLFLLKLRTWVGRRISSPPPIFIPYFPIFVLFCGNFITFPVIPLMKFYIYNSCHNGYLDPYPCIPRAKNTYPSFKQSSIHPSTLVIYSICQFLPVRKTQFQFST